MLCVIAVNQKDREQAQRLAAWIAELGNVKKHQVMIVLARGVSAEGIEAPLKTVFRNVAVMNLHDRDPRPIEKDLPDGGKTLSYANAANLMFRRSAKHIEFHGNTIKQKAIAHNQANPKNRREIPNPEPWLWLEPDAIPLHPDWLEVLDAAYRNCGKKFMGARVVMPPIPEHMSGIAVYPWNAGDIAPLLVTCDLAAFDVNSADEVLPKMAETNLIQHEWRPSEEWADLSRLRPGAVIYHQNKTGSLIDAMRRQYPWKMQRGVFPTAEPPNEHIIGFDPAIPGSERTVIHGVDQHGQPIALPQSAQIGMDSIARNHAEHRDLPSPNDEIAALKARLAEAEAALARKRGKKIPRGRKRKKTLASASASAQSVGSSQAE